MYRLLLYSCIVIFCLGCRKESTTRTALIKGRLLQSSSNPVPAANYKLSFIQSGSNAVFIALSTSTSTADFTTNSEGYFSCNFPLGQGYFFGIPTRDKDPIQIYGWENNTFQLGWGNLSLNDTDLHVMYLFKKVHQAVIQIYVLDTLKPNEVIYINAPTLSGNYSKQITGLSVLPSNTITVDTIPDVVFTRFSFQTKTYQNSVSVTRYQNISPPAGTAETLLDEEQKTYQFTLY